MGASVRGHQHQFRDDAAAELANEFGLEAARTSATAVASYLRAMAVPTERQAGVEDQRGLACRYCGCQLF